jgi:hypothetical protein
MDGNQGDSAIGLTAVQAPFPGPVFALGLGNKRLQIDFDEPAVLDRWSPLRTGLTPSATAQPSYPGGSAVGSNKIVVYPTRGGASQRRARV